MCGLVIQGSSAPGTLRRLVGYRWGILVLHCKLLGALSAGFPVYPVVTWLLDRYNSIDSTK